MPCKDGSAPSHPGRNRQMPMPSAAMPQPRRMLKIMDCRSTPRASSWRSAPRYCAIWMAKDVNSPTRMPWSSQVLELTMPMAAVASAPMWPTMAASMYSIAVTTSCCRMAGTLRATATRAVSPSGMLSPCRIRAARISSESVMRSPLQIQNGKAIPIIIRGKRIVNQGRFCGRAIDFYCSA